MVSSVPSSVPEICWDQALDVPTLTRVASQASPWDVYLSVAIRSFTPLV